MHHAALQNSAGVVDALVEAEADPNAERRGHEVTPLLCALDYLCVEAMRAFLRRGVPVRPNRRYSPLLYLAAEQDGKCGSTEVGIS